MIKVNKKFVVLASLVLLLSGMGASATIDQVGDAGQLPKAEPPTVIRGIFNAVAAIMAIVAALMIVIGGIMWMTAGGNADNETRARQLIIAAVVGLIIIGAAVGIVNFVVGRVF